MSFMYGACKVRCPTGPKGDRYVDEDVMKWNGIDGVYIPSGFPMLLTPWSDWCSSRF